MRTASVFTHYRCNQRCSYCTFRRRDDTPLFIARDAVGARIREALADGATELTLTGGEPAMRGDLVQLVAYAKGLGAEAIVLATNATLIDPARASALKSAGLDRAVVNLVGFGDEIDAVTSDEGGFAASRAGIHAFASANVPVIVEVAIVRSTLVTSRALPSVLVREYGGAIAGVVLAVPTSSPDESELLRYEELVSHVTHLVDDARAVGLPIQFSPDASPPPCVFPQVGRVAHLYSLTRGARTRVDHAPIEACASCVMSDRCPGFAHTYLDRWGTPRVSPVTEDRLRRRLSLIGSVADQVARELVTYDRYSSVDTGEVAEDLVRVNFHCNQSCRFCFVSTHLPTAPDAKIFEAIEDAARGGRRITLSGGEPTLNPSLVAYVRHAKARSPYPIRLQTNAIRLAQDDLADALVTAGVEEAFVSLHGSNAAISDAITHAPGTFAKTVVGIDNLVARGVRVILNFVICQSNLTDLVPYVRLVADRWPSVSINISFVAPSTDVVPREPEFIPRYADVTPQLAAALELARQRGISIVGFESMCGIPLCLVPTSLDVYYGLSQIAEGADETEFVRAPACATCDLRGRCHGVRRGYAELHGTAELRTVRSAVAS